MAHIILVTCSQKQETQGKLHADDINAKDKVLKTCFILASENPFVHHFNCQLIMVHVQINHPICLIRFTFNQENGKLERR